MKPTNDITALLQAMQNGDPGAFDALVPLVYEELKKIARSKVSQRNSSETLFPTVLVHDALLRLRDYDALTATNRAHFYAIAAKCMRWVVADYARRNRRKKRGGSQPRVSFREEVHSPRPSLEVDLLGLHNALKKLSRLDEELSKIVELRFLVGLTLEETASALELSVPTVSRRWTMAKSWLLRELRPDEEQSAA